MDGLKSHSPWPCGLALAWEEDGSNLVASSFSSKVRWRGEGIKIEPVNLINSQYDHRKSHVGSRVGAEIGRYKNWKQLQVHVAPPNNIG